MRHGCWHLGKFGKYVDRMDLVKHFQTLSLSFYRTFLAIPQNHSVKNKKTLKICKRHLIKHPVT